MMHWRIGGKEKQLRADAHQKNSEIDMSLEWSQTVHKALMFLSCPPVPQRQQWENTREDCIPPG